MMEGCRQKEKQKVWACPFIWNWTIDSSWRSWHSTLTIIWGHDVSPQKVNDSSWHFVSNSTTVRIRSPESQTNKSSLQNADARVATLRAREPDGDFNGSYRRPQVQNRKWVLWTSAIVDSGLWELITGWNGNPHQSGAIGMWCNVMRAPEPGEGLAVWGRAWLMAPGTGRKLSGSQIVLSRVAVINGPHTEQGALSFSEIV